MIARTARVFSALGPIDLRSVRRDPLLRWIALYPILIALIVRAATRPFGAWLAERFGVEAAAYYPLVMGFLAMMPPMLVGVVVGFLLLDQRDDRTLAALSVTPLSPRGYLAYRLAAPMAVGGGVTIATLWAAGLPMPSPAGTLAVAIAAAPVAPFYALVLAAFADNKVQGFAVSKGMGVLVVPPLAAWFVAPPWQWVLGLDPLYWPAKLYWVLMAGEPIATAAAYFLAGLAWQLAIVAALLRRYGRRSQPA